MNKVFSSFLDDSHRGLQRQQQGLGSSTSHVQLPPLRPDSGPPTVGGDRDGSRWEKGCGFLQHSQSAGSFEISQEKVTQGMQQERYQQALQENDKLARRMRALQEQLAITSAKKEAFKAQAQRLEREFKKGREQSDTLQRELLEAKREANQLAKDAQEAVQMMTEMRKAHIHEVRLLQRGLAMRGNDEKSRNRVNEVADLVDKLGRAVVQRDEAIRERTKMQAQLNKTSSDLRALTDDCAKLRRQNRQLADSLREAQRKAQFVPPRPETEAPEDSDEEFEHELSAFEKRFEILEEGPAGLDILASNLSKDKETLQRRLRAELENIQALNGDVANWKKVCTQKDFEIEDLTFKIDKMMRDQAALQEQIAQKRREIEQLVEANREQIETTFFGRMQPERAHLRGDYIDPREAAAAEVPAGVLPATTTGGGPPPVFDADWAAKAAASVTAPPATEPPQEVPPKAEPAPTSATAPPAEATSGEAEAEASAAQEAIVAEAPADAPA